MSAKGIYITKDDMTRTFGRVNISEWSNLDNLQASEAEDTIQAAIDFAEAEINDRFRPTRYLVPLVGLGGTLQQVKQWAVRLAALQLYMNRGFDDTVNADEESARMAAIGKIVRKEMDNYVAGQMRLNAALVDTMPTAPVVIR